VGSKQPLGGPLQIGLRQLYQLQPAKPTTKRIELTSTAVATARERRDIGGRIGVFTPRGFVALGKRPSPPRDLRGLSEEC
jgi:hypothetical protein